MLACASLASLHAQKVSFDNYTLKTGLPQNTVNDIVQDSRGFIWFATQVGASRYDGYTYEHFSISNGLPDDEVNCMLVDRQGKIWFGTRGGIGIYDGVKIDQITRENGLVDNHIAGMLEDLDGNVWAWSPSGISVITGDTILNYDSHDALTGNNVLDVMVDSQGRVHVATYSKTGITIFSDPYTYEKLPQEEIVRDIIEASPGEIWYATQGMGILVRDETGDHWLHPSDGLGDEIVLSMLRESSGKILCSTYMEGLYVYEKGRFRQVDTPDDSEPIAQDILEDSHGRIWIRGFSDGVWMLDQDLFKHYTIANNLVNNDVNKVFEDRFGNIWIGTIGGVSKYGRAIFEIYDLDFGLPSNSILSVLYDSRGRVWSGTNNSLQYITGDDLVILGEQVGLPEDASILSFAEDRAHHIYIGTGEELLYYNGRSVEEVGLKALFKSLLYTDDGQLWCATDSGVHILKNGKFSMLGTDDGLVNLQVNSLMQMGNVVCCATEGGLSLFDLSGQHIRNYTEEDGLAPAVYLDVTCDYHDNLWVATKSRGVSRINPGIPNAIENYNTDHGLVSNSTYFVEFADSVSLWIGTNLGINVLNTETGEIEFYGYDEGFYPLETNSRAIARGEGGELWIGTMEGLVHYDPRYDIKDPNPPELVLYPPVVDGILSTSIVPENRGISGMFPDHMTFPYGKNSLEFNFTGIHTTNPSRNSFSWYLEGFDSGWSARSNERSAPYMRLPNGHYVFHVKAYNLDGVEVEHEASFGFTIKPPFWKAYWFIILEVLTGLALIFSIIKIRERQLVKEKRVLEVKVKERTREIEKQKMEIESQRDEITDSIQYARRIQQAVLPGKKTLERTLPEHFIFFKPRDIVSGDFYWMEKKEEQIVVCAADCTGHGVPGAFMSLLGLTFLNEIVNHEGVLKASEILNRLRTNIIRAMSHKDEAEQAKDGMDISLVVIDRQLGMLEFSGAYNPLILIRNGEIMEYKGDSMPVGKHVIEEKPFSNQRIRLERDDMLYLYSDGFPDQFGGEKGSKYKARPFKNFLARISVKPVKDQAALLEEELKNWKGKEFQVDDILVIGIRYMK